MKNILLISVLSLVLLGCNEKKIIELENRIIGLESEIIEKDSIIKNFQENDEIRRRLRELEENKIKQHSNSEIIRIVREDREFNCPESLIKDFKVRYVNENIYNVSLKIKVGKQWDWSSNIYTITFYENNQYILKLKKGTFCK